jgi:hypothetical protein
MDARTSGRLGGLTLATKPDYDADATAARARKGLAAKWLREADPDGTLPEAERQKRADRLMEMHLIRMREARWKGKRKGEAK